MHIRARSPVKNFASSIDHRAAPGKTFHGLACTRTVVISDALVSPILSIVIGARLLNPAAEPSV
jgi:hypothetical protein